MCLPTQCPCCQPVTHSYSALGDRRVPQGPQALTQQEETMIRLAEGQNVPERIRRGSESWQGWLPGAPLPVESRSLARGVFSQTPC